MSNAGNNKNFGAKMGDWFRHILSCCDRDEEEERPVLQIGHPTNFRREDISMLGLDAETQRWIREKAMADAGRMYDHLQPLRSSPSGEFASPRASPDARATLPSYEQFTTPRSAPSPLRSNAPPVLPPINGIGSRRMSTSTGQQASPPLIDRVKAHTRKISASLTKPIGYQAVGRGHDDGGQPFEMRSLMDPSRTQSLEGKGSGDSLSFRGSEGDGYGDADSAKGGISKGGIGIKLL